jgi:hypothetical protein
LPDNPSWTLPNYKHRRWWYFPDFHIPQLQWRNNLKALWHTQQAASFGASHKVSVQSKNPLMEGTTIQVWLIFKKTNKKQPYLILLKFSEATLLQIDEKASPPLPIRDFTDRGHCHVNA